VPTELEIESEPESATVAAMPSGSDLSGDFESPCAETPSQKRFFYGWLMLPVTICAHLATSPGQTYGISVFNTYFRTELGLSHSELTGAYMLGTLLACLPLSFIGAWADRAGLRRAMTVVVVLLGAACLFASQITGLFTLFVSFFLLRLLAQGALSLLAGNTLAMWFHRRLGTVSGLVGVCVVCAIAEIPAKILDLIHLSGWRTAYAILGATVCAVMLPLLAVVFRNRPEDVGQLPDGDLPGSHNPKANEASGRSLIMVEFDLDAAMKTRAYWIMGISCAAWAMVGTAIVFNCTPLFLHYGLTEQDAVTTLSQYFYATAAMLLLGGFLADRLPLSSLLTTALIAMTCGLIILIRSSGESLAWGYTVFGLGQGLLAAVHNTLWARYFGRAHLGKIRGTIATMSVAGSGIGPFVMGFVYDRSSNYDLALWMFLALMLTLTVVAPLATRPKHASLETC